MGRNREGTRVRVSMVIDFDEVLDERTASSCAREAVFQSNWDEFTIEIEQP